MIDSEASSSFGGDLGVESFMEFWKVNHNPDNSLVWQELQAALDLEGVSKSGTEMIFPYLFTDWPDSDASFYYDPFIYEAVTGSRVNLRDKPSMQGNILRQISYEIIRVIDSNGTLPKGWVKAQTHDRKIGYISSRYVRSPIYYRLGFRKKADGWKIDYFVAGD